MLPFVDNETVPLFESFLFGYFGCGDKQFAKDGLMLVFSLGNARESVLDFRDDKNMGGCLWRDVPKGKDLLVLKDDGCGYLFAYDLVKDGLSHDVSYEPLL